MKRINLIVSFMMLSLAFLTGCGQDVVEEVKISLNKSVLALDKGQSEVLKATVKPADAKVDIKWTSSDNSVANVNSDGTVTGISAGDAVITVAAGQATASCKVTVRPTAVQEVVLDRTSLDMLVGDKDQLKATVLPEDADDVKVTWKSLNTNVVSVDASGNVEALAEGKATVVAEAGGKIAQCMISVGLPVVNVESVKITKYPETMVIGDIFTFEAVVTPDDATDKSVVWSSANKEVISISADGKAEAVNEGTVEVSVKTNDGDKTDKVVVIVKSPVVPVEKVTIDNKKEGEAVTLNKGESYTLEATVAPSNATDKTIEWTVSDSKVLSVDQSGKVTALAAGTAKVTVTTKDGGKTDECSFVVVVPVEKVEITAVPQDNKMIEGDEFRFVAAVTPADATDKTLAWTSSQTSVLTIDQDGKAVAIKAGKATVTVSSADGKCTASCEITVEEPAPVVIPVAGVTLDVTSLELEVGQQATLKATVTPEDATDKTVTWTSSNAEVAEVTSGVVVAKSAGEAVISVKTADGDKTATCKVTVKARYIPVESIKITSYVTNITEGESYQFVAEVLPENATDGSFVWSTSNKDVLAVDEKGFVTAVAPGVADIMVKTTDGNKTDVCTVTVEPQIVAVESVKIVTSPNSDLMNVGQTFKFAAIVSPADAADKTVTWSSSAPEVLAIDAQGNARAIAAGKAVVTVTTKDGGKTDSRTITVEIPKVPVTSVELTSIPEQNKMKEGETFTFVAKVNPDDATDKTVRWTTSDDRVLTIDANGKAVAVASGSATVTVTTNDGGKVAKCLVTVVKAIQTSVTKVTLTAENGLTYVRHGKTLQLQPNYEPLGSYPGEVKWFSNNEALATVDETGLVKGVGFDYNKSYADYGYGENYPEVTITLNADGLIATYKLAVRPAVPEKVIVQNPPPTSLTIGEKWDMGKVTILPEEAEDRYTWYAVNDKDMQSSVGFADTQSNVFVATSVGVWALQVAATGNFASVDAEISTTLNYSVNVLPQYETAINLTKTSHTLEVGQSFSLSADFTPAEPTYKDVSWTSSNSSVATVSNGVVVAKSAGTATITAKSHHGKTAACQVTVTQRTSTVAIGDYYYSDGTTSSSLVSGKTPVGVVFALVDAAGSDPKSLGADHSGCSHGLVVGLESYSTKFAASIYMDLPMADVAANAKKAGMIDMTETKTYCGYSNTKAMRTWGEWTIVNTCSTVADHYAIPAATSGWYVPSLAEIDLLGDAYAVVNPKLEAIGASYEILPGQEFWCSTFFGVSASSYTYDIAGGDLAANLHQGTVSGAAQISSSSKYARYIFAF